MLFAINSIFLKKQNSTLWHKCRRLSLNRTKPRKCPFKPLTLDNVATGQDQSHGQLGTTFRGHHTGLYKYFKIEGYVAQWPKIRNICFITCFELSVMLDQRRIYWVHRHDASHAHHVKSEHTATVNFTLAWSEILNLRFKSDQSASTTIFSLFVSLKFSFGSNYFEQHKQYP